ncbi:zinc finger, CCHC-type containing protein [Tanacetum coccineum]
MAEHGEDKITEKIHNHDSSSSDSDTEKKVKYDDVKNKDDDDKVTSSKIADVFLWRNKKIYVVVTVTSSIARSWSLDGSLKLKNVLGYGDNWCPPGQALQIFRWLWKKPIFTLDFSVVRKSSHVTVNWSCHMSPPTIPKVKILEDTLRQVVGAVRIDMLRDVASGRDLKKFLAVVAALFLPSAFVALHTVPVLYEKYEDQVDACAEKAMIEFKKQYAIFDAKTQFDLTPHMQSQRWADINAGIQQHLQKLYNTNKASLKAAHWIAFWNDPRNQARAAQNRQNRAKSTVVCRQGSRSLARLRDEMEEMVRLRALGSNTESGVPYTDEEINAMARKGKQRGHLPGVGRVLPGRARDVLIPPPPPPPQCTHNSGDVQKLKKKNKYLTKQVNLMMKLFRSDDKFSQMLRQYESTPEFGSGSGGCGDDEIADDEDGGEDEEDEEDGDS